MSKTFKDRKDITCGKSKKKDRKKIRKDRNNRRDRTNKRDYEE